MPEAPEMPGVPVVPEVPELPDVPGVPDAPRRGPLPGASLPVARRPFAARQTRRMIGSVGVRRAVLDVWCVEVGLRSAGGGRSVRRASDGFLLGLKKVATPSSGSPAGSSAPEENPPGL